MDEFWRNLAVESGGLRAVITFAGFLLAVGVVRLLWMRVLGPLARRTATDLDDVVLLPLRTLALWGVLLLGLYHSLGSLTAVVTRPQVMGTITRALSVAAVGVVVWTVLRLVNGVFAWHVRRAAERRERAEDVSHIAALARKVIGLLVLALGLLYTLQVVGVDISPLLAGGAIGGLAVALALQDTLSNLFAGFHLTIDRPVKVGDFIRLESGEEGFIEEIGWRSTKVRVWANNVVVIPNTKLSQSVLMNYYLPAEEMSVYVPCGVSYDSDLQRVEEVVIEVARQVMSQVEGSALDWEPVVRWQEFGDFAVTFTTVLRVREFGAQYRLRSDFVKALHQRFRQEGIEIPFPIRTVIIKPTPHDPAAVNSSSQRPVGPTCPSPPQ